MTATIRFPGGWDEKIILKLDCECCERHKKNKTISPNERNKEVTEKTCSCSCRHDLRIALNTKNIFQILEMDEEFSNTIRAIVTLNKLGDKKNE